MPKVEGGVEIKTKVRETIYRTLYDREYRTGPRTQASESYESTAVKPYIPPTNPEDLSRVLDQPLGG